MARIRVVAYVDGVVAAKLDVMARSEARSLSGMAAKIIERAVGDGPVLVRDVEAVREALNAPSASVAMVSRLAGQAGLNAPSAFRPDPK